MGRGMAKLDRPTTENTENARVSEIQEELKIEKKDKKKLLDQIEGLKCEI